MLKDASRIVFCLGLLVTASSLWAQAFGYGVAAAVPIPPPQQIVLRVTASPSGMVAVGGNIRYDIVITNTSGAPLQPVTVDNVFSDSVDYVTASRTPDETNSNRVTFITQLLPNDVETISVTLRATAAGTVSNLVAVSSGAFPLGATNVATQVDATNAAPARADLALLIRADQTSVLVNDNFTVSITISNLGPDTVAGVSMTNTLGSNILIRSVSPSNSVAVSGQTAVFTTGSLVSNTSATAMLTLAQTTAGTFTFSGSLSSTNDPNPANNTSATSVNVGQPAAATGLRVTIGSEQIFNPQNSLMEQLVQIVNTGSTVVASARLILTNFLHRVVNAVGTNNGNPFVVHGRAIQTGEVVNLVLEYFIPTRQPVGDPGFVVVDAGMVNLNAPTVTTNVAVDIKPVDDRVRGIPTSMIEFRATPGTRYLILYSDSAIGNTNWLQAQPPIVARANRVQWIDHGPPKTLRHPSDHGTNAAVSKMYQAIPLP